MKRIHLPLIACLLVAGCAKSPEEEMVDTMNEMADVLATVKDEASAKKAKSRIEEIGRRGDRLKKEVDEDELSPEMKKKAEEAVRRIVKEMMRIGTDPALAQFMDDVDFGG